MKILYVQTYLQGMDIYENIIFNLPYDCLAKMRLVSKSFLNIVDHPTFMQRYYEHNNIVFKRSYYYGMESEVVYFPDHIRHTTYYKDRALHSIALYDLNLVKTGTHKCWHDNGKLAIEETYSNGLLNGQQSVFCKHGTELLSYYYVSGLPHICEEKSCYKCRK